MKKSLFLLLLIAVMSIDATAQPLPFGDIPPGVVKPSFGCGAVVHDEASRRKCAMAELRYIDGRLNARYHELRKELKPDEVSALSTAQRGWVKRRNASCALDARRRKHKAWLMYVASSGTRTNCVLQATENRVAALEQMQNQLGSVPIFADVAPKPEQVASISGEVRRGDLSTGDSLVKSARSHHSGKYYFEVVIDEAGIPEKLAAKLVVRINDGSRWIGTSYEIRRRDLVLQLPDKATVTIVGGDMGKYRLPKTVIGIAADLDASRLYYHRDGVWYNGAPPGSPQGIELSPGAGFMAEMYSSVPLKTLLEPGIVKVNFGNVSFERQPPTGYRAFDWQESVSEASQAMTFPPVYSPRDRIAGNTQVQWIQRYWEWVRSFTPDESPSADTSGYRCGAGQSGPVWFLTGSRKSASVKRECQAPDGKILMVPIVNVLAQANAVKQTGCDKLLMSLRRYGSSATGLYMKVNGMAMKSPEKYFLGTGCFNLRNAASGEMGLAAGTGYWVFLKPMKKGRYEIEFGGRYAADDYTQNIKYVLHVQ